jgi:hypothetical protein
LDTEAGGSRSLFVLRLDGKTVEGGSMDAALFQICSALFAVFAAIVWAWSSLVNLPVIGPSYGTIQNLKPFYLAIKKIALLNASAAAFAFLSALSQAMAFYLMLYQ